MGEACPAARAAFVRPQGASCGGKRPPLPELRGVAGSAVSGLAGARLQPPRRRTGNAGRWERARSLRVA
jgi:hypothetical protein